MLRVRFTPNEVGQLGRPRDQQRRVLERQTTHIHRHRISAPGFVQAANVHHFANSGPFAYNALPTPHLWMGQVIPQLGALSREQFAQLAATRAKQKFNHFRVTLLEPETAKAFKGPEDFDPAVFREIDEKLAAANKQGIAIDLSLAGPDNAVHQTVPRTRPAPTFRPVRRRALRRAQHDLAGRRPLRDLQQRPRTDERDRAAI